MWALTASDDLGLGRDLGPVAQPLDQSLLHGIELARPCRPGSSRSAALACLLASARSRASSAASFSRSRFARCCASSPSAGRFSISEVSRRPRSASCSRRVAPRFAVEARRCRRASRASPAARCSRSRSRRVPRAPRVGASDFMPYRLKPSPIVCGASSLRAGFARSSVEHRKNCRGEKKISPRDLVRIRGHRLLLCSRAQCDFSNQNTIVAIARMLQLRIARLEFFSRLIRAIDKFFSSLPVRLDETLPKLVEFTLSRQSTQSSDTKLRSLDSPRLCM